MGLIVAYGDYVGFQKVDGLKDVFFAPEYCEIDKLYRANEISSQFFTVERVFVFISFLCAISCNRDSEKISKFFRLPQSLDVPRMNYIKGSAYHHDYNLLSPDRCESWRIFFKENQTMMFEFSKIFTKHLLWHITRLDTFIQCQSV